MSKTITITVSDEAYEALQSAAQQAHRSPEALVADAVATRFHGAPDAGTSHVASEQVKTQTDADRQAVAYQEALDRLTAVMRERGHLAEPQGLPTPFATIEIPPEGSPEREQWEEELGNELSDALE